MTKSLQWANRHSSSEGYIRISLRCTQNLRVSWLRGAEAVASAAGSRERPCLQPAHSDRSSSFRTSNSPRRAGFPADTFVVKPDFADADPGEAGEYALFVRLLVETKGLRVLLNAWQQLPAQYPPPIVGTDPRTSRSKRKLVNCSFQESPFGEG